MKHGFLSSHRQSRLNETLRPYIDADVQVLRTASTVCIGRSSEQLYKLMIPAVTIEIRGIFWPKHCAFRFADRSGFMVKSSPQRNACIIVVDKTLFNSANR